jgi:hypothetical protein
MMQYFFITIYMTGVFKKSLIFDTIWIVYLYTLFVVMCVEVEGIICYTGGKGSDWLLICV